MIIQFKEAPELGRLKVVSDDVLKGKKKHSPCFSCALHVTPACTVYVYRRCVRNKIHFVQVKPNDQQT